MDKTKTAIKDFMSKSGHHDTTHHHEVAPAVTHETVKPTQHEHVNTAVDKEVHQDHYHTTVQPVHDKEVLPEQHHHNIGEVEHRKIDHRDHDHTERALAAESQKHHDKHVVTDTTHTQAHAPVTQGEHVHHHVHETVQPVLHKEVIQPSVVHTTVPIHEVHHNAAQHHSSTTLPAVSLADFKNKGGALGGRGGRTDEFDGCPDGVDCKNTTHNHTGTTGHTVGTAGHTGSAGHTGTAGHTGAGNHTNPATAAGHAGTHQGHGHTEATTTKKPSLMNKLNPMTDSNGDGQKGFMK